MNSKRQKGNMNQAAYCRPKNTGRLGTKPSRHDDLATWATWRPGTIGDLGQLATRANWRRGPPNDLDKLAIWATWQLGFLHP